MIVLFFFSDISIKHSSVFIQDFEQIRIMVVATNIFHTLCFIECCSKYWVPQNTTGNIRFIMMIYSFFYFAELDLRLRDQLMGQPLAYNLILKSISAHINTENPSKALVLSFHGSTGTGNDRTFQTRRRLDLFFREKFRR